MKSIYAFTFRVSISSLSHRQSSFDRDLQIFSNEASKGHYNRDTAIRFRDTARNSIGSFMPAMELKHTIELIQIISSEIDEIEFEIKRIMNDINSPILSIPGISYHMGAMMIIAEIGDFSNFHPPIKYFCLFRNVTIYNQSGHLTNCYALYGGTWLSLPQICFYNATQHVCRWDKTFADYLAKSVLKASITMLPYLMLQRNS